MRSFLIVLICMLVSAGLGSGLVVSGDPGAPSYAKDLAGLVGAVKWAGIGFLVGLIFVLIPKYMKNRFLPCVLALCIILLLGWSDFNRAYYANRKQSLVDMVSKGSVTLDSLVYDWNNRRLPEWKTIGLYAGLMYGKPITPNNLEQLWKLCYNEDPKQRWIVERIIFYDRTPPELINQIYTEYTKNTEKPVSDELLLAFAKSGRTPTQILLKLKSNPNVYVSSFAKENLGKRPSNTPLEPPR